MPVHFETLGGRNPLIQAALDRELQIDDRITLFADEMVVVGDVRIKAVEGTAKGNSTDQALLDENSDVSIDCSHTEVGKLLLQPSE